MIHDDRNVKPMPDPKHRRRVRIILGALATVAAASDARYARAGALPDSEPTASTQSDERRESTADALLRELRAARPDVEVVPPASAPGGVWPIAEPKLLPEGAVLVERTGRVQATAESWRFEFHPPADPAFVNLLPNTSLEMMVRTAAASSEAVYFVVSGDVTNYRDENHLLVRLARRATEIADADPTRDSHPNRDRKGADAASSVLPDAVPGRMRLPFTRSVKGQPARPPVPHREGNSDPSAETVARESSTTTDRSSLAPPSAEDTLSLLQAEKPRDILLPAPVSSIPKGLDLVTSAAPTLRPEGATLVNRPGRILRSGDSWNFVFESDHPDHPEPPMKLLASRGVELMAVAAAENQRGLVFLVSGEVTIFNGENYFLPTFVIRRIEMGNLRP